MTEASDLKFGAQLGFAKDHHKVARRRKWGVALDWELAKIWSFPFNIYRMAEASDFNFGTQLGFAKAHHKITPIGKSGCRLGLGSSTNISGSPLIFLQRLRCPLNVSGSSCTCITWRNSLQSKLKFLFIPTSNKVFNCIVLPLIEARSLIEAGGLKAYTI